MHSVQLHLNRTLGAECQVWGRTGGVLVSVNQWYLKRGFLEFCFFNEDETHLADLFSSISPALEAFCSSAQLQGRGTAGMNKWLATKLTLCF